MFRQPVRKAKRLKSFGPWGRREEGASFRPTLEVLEDRRLLTVTLNSSYIGMDVIKGEGFVPPDTCGAAGTTNYVETVNQAVTIYTPKATGTTAVTDSFDDFWVTQGGLTRASATSFLSDPIVVWDDQVQRFIVGDQDVDNTNHVSTFDLAVSKSASPTTLTSASWTFFQINTTEANHDSDYPGNFGYNHDAFVFTLSQFPVAGTGATFHVQVTSIAINATGTLSFFQNDIDSQTLRPTVMHDSVAGDPMWLIAEGASNSINVVKMTNVLSNAATFTTTNLSVNPYSTVVPPLQPDGTPITFNIDSRILKAAELNNTIVASQAISTSATEDDARWYAIDVSSGTPTIKDQGNVSAGNNTYIVYPGVDINSSGDIGMTYIQSGTGTGQFMSMYITGRNAGDPAGTMQAPVLVQAGTSNDADTREGDLSGINVDSDGTFWAANEWAAALNSWGTAIAHFTVIPPVKFSINDVTQLEGNSGTTDFVFTVTASGTVFLAASVEFASADGTAIAPGDYAAKSGTLTFQPGGSPTQTITIQVVGDTLVEPDETFFVKLSNAKSGQITRSTGAGTILNDDLNLAVNDITVVEGDSGTNDAVFTVSAEGISHLTAIVNFATADGTANSGSDYLSRGGVLIFPPGTTARTVTVPIVGDLLNEGTETFVVNLTNAVSAQITKAIGVGTILDDDLLPALYVNDVHVTTTQAGVLAAVFTVALDAPSGRDVSVQFATADGSAQAGLNYTAESGVVDFAPGATTKLVTVPVTSMATYAPNEKFYLNLSNPLHAALADPQGVGTIIFADPPPTEYIMDDGDPGYSQTAGWTNLTNTLAYQLDYNYHAAGTGTGAATWTFGDIPTGSYQVFAHWIPFSNWATNAPFTVLDGANALGTVLVSQQQAPTGDQSNGITWQSLGTFQTSSGTLAVRLDDNANGFVIADAIRIVSEGIAPQIPEMDVAGFDRSIADGATTPSFDDGTDFGGIASTTGSATHTFTITNTGNADLHLTGSPAVEITGVNPQDFTVISQPATTIAAGASTTFQVMFHPATTGPRQAIVSIANDDGNEQPYTFELQGTGLAAGPSQLTIDDTMPVFRTIGNWATNPNSLAYSGQFHSAAAGQGADQSIWTFSGLAPGQYQVLATWVPFGNRATNAPFTVADGTVSQHAVTVNQQQAPSDVSANGVMWSSLFSVNVTTGTLTVSLGNQANGFVVADAVRIVNTDPPPAVPIVAAHNLAMPLDVNGDNHVSSLDALIVINKLNAQSVAKASAPGAMSLAALATSSTAAGSNYFVDVNGDGAVSPLDALVVINYLLHAPSQMNPAAAMPQASSAASLPAAMTSAAVDQAIGQFVATQPPDAGLPANLTSAVSTTSAASSPTPTATTNLLTPLAVRAYFASSAKKSASGSGSELDTLFGT